MLPLLPGTQRFAPTMRLPRKLLFALAAIVLLALGAWLTRGTVHGVEWSPDLLAHRSFRYHVVYWCIPVTPNDSEQWQTSLDEWLAEQPCDLAPEDPSRWYFVRGMAPSVRGWRGAACNTCIQFGCWGTSENDHWIEWSETYPNAAVDLWPRVLGLVRHDENNCDVAAQLLAAVSDIESEHEYAQRRDAFLEQEYRAYEHHSREAVDRNDIPQAIVWQQTAVYLAPSGFREKAAARLAELNAQLDN